MTSIYRNAKTYQDICEILCRHDPIGLTSMGAPPDEYDSEAEMIYDNLLRKKYATVHALRKMIFEVFDSMFSYGTDTNGKKISIAGRGLAGTEQTYQGPAEEIFRLIYQ